MAKTNEKRTKSKQAGSPAKAGTKKKEKVDKSEKSTNFPHEEVEKKWIMNWDESGIYRTPDGENGKAKRKKEKYYCLDMYPYPSGAGLHMGHMENYTATDIVARYMRMKGFSVLHPMGWDSFGLPTENYAIKTGKSPKEHTRESTDVFRNQQKSLGCSYDWEREFGSHEPEYYKWTQWLFTFLYENDLAYRAKAPVNWCDSCQTVLANEQVIDGKCERCDSEVRQKMLDQWFFRITKYADRLLEDLELIDWPESTKEGQRNWIGRSEGAMIKFVLADKKSEGGKAGEKSDSVRVFTTRPDTIFGATYLVLAPEHPMVEKVTKKEQKGAVEKYQKQASKKTEIERSSVKKAKTGVFTGSYVTNPANKEKIPVWVADYVTMGYGTGAIMAVPAHDERDYLFAKKYKLEIRDVIKHAADADLSEYYTDKEAKYTVYTGEGTMINSGDYDGMKSKEFGRVIVEDLRKELGEDSANFDVQYRIRDWLVSRQRYWGAPIPVIHCEKCGPVAVPKEDLPVLLPDDVKEYRPKGKPPLGNSKEFTKPVKCPKCGANGKRELDTMDTFVCSSWYYYRFCDPTNDSEFASQDAIEKWMPVDYYMGGAEHTVGHLCYSRFITKALYDAGVVKFKEPFKKLRHQGMVLAEDGRKMSKRWGNVVNPDDVVQDAGADAARMYTMFMGPIEASKAWSTKDLQGVKRFIDRIWRAREMVKDDLPKKKEKPVIHKLIKRTGENIDALKFNVSVSDFMKFINYVFEKKGVTKDSWKKFVVILAPYAPFIAEELWAEAGEKYSVHEQKWPEYDKQLVKDEEVTVAVQVNGKVRGEILISPTASEKTAVEAALKVENVQKHIESEENIKKKIYVPGRIVNFIV